MGRLILWDVAFPTPSILDLTSFLLSPMSDGVNRREPRWTVREPDSGGLFDVVSVTVDTGDGVNIDSEEVPNIPIKI